MNILKAKIKECKIKILHGGKCPLLTKLAKLYKDSHNISHYPFDYSYTINNTIGKKIADVYEALNHEPNNELVKSSYNRLAIEVINQFDFIIKNSELKFEPYLDEGEPYANSYKMLEDIHNHHLYFFITKNGFGESNTAKNNIMLQETDYKIGSYTLVVNDVFRIVHDIFGHAMNGYGFGPKGEDKAWFAHLKMFSPLAAAALSMETRGQNCWVNFGPHLRNKEGQLFKEGEEGWLPPPKRPFADQKMNLLPSYITGIEVFKEQDMISARYLDFWDPILSISKKYK